MAASAVAAKVISRSVFDNFIVVTSFLLKCKYQVFAVLCSRAFVVEYAVAEPFVHLRMVSVSAHAEGQAGIFAYFVFKEF